MFDEGDVFAVSVATVAILSAVTVALLQKNSVVASGFGRVFWKGKDTALQIL